MSSTTIGAELWSSEEIGTLAVPLTQVDFPII